jgi:hypothetical protein
MKVIAFILMLAFSILVLAIGMPVLEPSRQEARFAQASLQARQIKAGTLPINTVDPWERPFRIIKNDQTEISLVVSLGPNGSTGAAGYDDVGSGMSSLPHQTIMRRKQLQLLTALILSASPWLILSAMVFLAMVRRPRPTASEITSSPPIGTTA